MSKNIFVYGDWESLVQPTLIGVLNVDLLKGKELRVLGQIVSGYLDFAEGLIVGSGKNKHRTYSLK